MIDTTIPGRGTFRIKQLVLDLNGTIALDGKIINGVAERLDRLSGLLDIFIITSDTMGSAERVIKDLKVKLHKIKKDNETGQKLELLKKIGETKTIAIGNGSNDVLMLKESLIGICVLGREGASKDAIMASDLVISDINDALDLLFKPNRLAATLRK